MSAPAILPPRLDAAVTALQLALGRALQAPPHVAVEVVREARTALALEVRAVVQGELARASGGYRVGN